MLNKKFEIILINDLFKFIFDFHIILIQEIKRFSMVILLNIYNIFLVYLFSLVNFNVPFI